MTGVIFSYFGGDTTGVITSLVFKPFYASIGGYADRITVQDKMTYQQFCNIMSSFLNVSINSNKFDTVFTDVTSFIARINPTNEQYVGCNLLVEELKKK